MIRLTLGEQLAFTAFDFGAKLSHKTLSCYLGKDTPFLLLRIYTRLSNRRENLRNSGNQGQLRLHCDSTRAAAPSTANVSKVESICPGNLSVIESVPGIWRLADGAVLVFSELDCLSEVTLSGSGNRANGRMGPRSLSAGDPSPFKAPGDFAQSPAVLMRLANPFDCPLLFPIFD